MNLIYGYKKNLTINIYIRDAPIGFVLADTDTDFNKQQLADTDIGQSHKAGL